MKVKEAYKTYNANNTSAADIHNGSTIRNANPRLNKFPIALRQTNMQNEKCCW